MATTRNQRGERVVAAWKAEVLVRGGKMMEEREPIHVSVFYVSAVGNKHKVGHYTHKTRRFETIEEVQAAIDSREIKFHFQWIDVGEALPYIDLDFSTAHPIESESPRSRFGSRWHIKSTIYHPKSLLAEADWSDSYATPTASAIAAGIVESGDWSRLVILADAIQDAGCEDAALLGLMRLAGGLGLDMGGWWLMERMIARDGHEGGMNWERTLEQVKTENAYMRARGLDPRQGGEEAKRK